MAECADMPDIGRGRMQTSFSRGRFLAQELRLQIGRRGKKAAAGTRGGVGAARAAGPLFIVAFLSGCVYRHSPCPSVRRDGAACFALFAILPAAAVFGRFTGRKRRRPSGPVAGLRTGFCPCAGPPQDQAFFERQCRLFAAVKCSAKQSARRKANAFRRADFLLPPDGYGMS